MSYFLSQRQQIAYTDRMDVYRDVNWDNKANQFKEDTEYNTTPVYSNAPCLWMNHPDINTVKHPIGQILMENSDVLDVVDFPAGMTILAGDALHIKTAGHPQRGEWLIVMGFGALRIARGNRQGNYVQVRAKRMLAPPGLEGITL